MNQADRKKLSDMQALLEGLKDQAGQIGQDISSMADAEQEKFDNLNEGLRAGEQGQAIEQAANDLAEVAAYLEEGNIGEALSALEGMG